MSPHLASAQQRFELLNRFANLLLEADTEEAVAWAIAKQAIAHLGFEDCVIYLKDQALGDLVQVAAHGPKNPKEDHILNSIRIPMGEGIVGSAALSGKVQRVNDVTMDPRYVVDDEARASELAVPMMHKGECLGVVDSEDGRKGFYTDEHQATLETVAALGAARIVHLRALVALQKSQSEYRKLIEDASDIVFTTDLAGRFTYMNPVAVRLTGYSEEELRSMRFTALLASSFRSRVMAFYREQYRSREQNTYLEFQFVSREGRIFWVGQNLQLVYEGEEIVGFQGVTRDITRLKNAQLEVDRSRSIQTAMLSGALDAIISIDDKGTVVEFNAAAEATFGYARAETIGQKLASLIVPEEFRSAHREGMERLLRTGEPRLIGKRVEVPALHKDGHTFPLELTLTQVETDEGVRFTAFARDITEQKENQEALEKAKKQAERNADAQVTFLSRMSHEIRTPLNAVIGISHLLESTDLSGKQQKYIQDIQRAGDVLLGLINNILDFQKIEAGFVEIEAADFDLAELLEEIVDRARYLASDKPVEVVLSTGYGVPEWINSDSVRLTQILTNLLNNAVKFTPRGRVSLSISLQREDTDHVVLDFEVRDTGIGIPEEAKERVFDTFKQASSDTTRRYGGSGLGLPIVKQLVSLFGGDVRFESEEGKGTCFQFSLPLKVTDRALIPERKADIAGLTLHGVRVLVVEDNLVNQFVVREMLESWKAFVTVASRGAEALDFLSRETFDVVLMDIQMPDMDGFETTHRIREDLQLTSESLPVIALTASALREKRDRAYAAGMNDFVMKPFDPAYLHERIVLAVGLERITDSQVSEADSGSGSDTPGADTEATADGPSSQASDSAPAVPDVSVPEAGLMDWRFFEENYGDKPGLRRRVVRILAEKLPDNIASLRDGLRVGDAAAVRSVAHQLLPSLRMMAGSALVDIAVILDKEGLNAETLQSNGTRFVDLLGRFSSEVESILEEDATS